MQRSVFSTLTLIAAVVFLTPLNVSSQPSYKERDNRSPGDFVEFLKTFGADSWAVVRSPVDADRGNWIAIGTVMATFTVLYQYDGDIQNAVEDAPEDGLLDAIENVGSTFEKLGLMGKTNRYYALGIAVGYTMKWEKLERVSTDILFSHFIGGLLRQGFVAIVDRSRPNEEMGTYHYGDGGTSLPSGHSSTIFQLATVMSHHFPRWWLQTVFYGIAGSVAVQRVTVEQHFASDSFLGAAYGYAIGRLIVGANDERGYLVTPAVMPTGDVGAALQFQF